MKVYEFYFSPTGGTKKVSSILTNQLTDEAISVNFTDSKTDFCQISLTQNDVAIIAVPSYGGRVPKTAAKRLATLQGNGARAILVCVYGNRAYEDTLVELQDITKQAGFRVIAAVSAIAEHSIVRQVAAGRPDKQDVHKLLEFAKEIQKKVSSGDTMEPDIPGNRPYKKASEVGMIPKPTKGCVKCGLCAKECPVQAIDVNNPKNIDKHTCISCMRCIFVCPHSARKLNPIALSAIGVVLNKLCAVRKECELFLY